jgi:serine/threonine-protein kinase
MEQTPPPPSDHTSADPPPAFPEGLEAIRPLGDGQMARVYLARETELERTVAVKVLRPEMAADETARLRFEREARSVASLVHPNVVSVHRFGRLPDGTPYLVMTHVHGRTLADRLHADGVLPEGEVRSILAQLASALAAAHRKGVVHRDVRPANVLLDEDSGRCMLTDFGIAALLEGGGGASQRLTRTGQIIGEPRYASPEQLRGERVTPQADIYSLAVLAYETLAGEGPYRARSMREVIAAHLTGEPIPISQIRPGISSDLEALLLRCLSRQPAHRPRAEDIARRLEEGSRAAPDVGAAAHGQGLGIMRRRIPHVVATTFTAGLVFTELVQSLTDDELLPAISYRLSLNLAAWALAASAVLAWFHGEKGKQSVPMVEKWILAVLAVGWLLVTVVSVR